MKVLVADKFEKSGIDGLQAAGCEVVFEPDLKDAALTEAIAKTGADVLVVRSTQVTEPMLDAGRLALIVRAGAGYNTIDVKAASMRGIYVSNCPGKNSIAVAELAFGLMIALDRRIPDNTAELLRGKWNKKEYSKAKGLYGSTLGILGFGRIGQEVAKRAMAFGMNLVIWSEMGVAVNRDAIPVDLPLLLQLHRGAEAKALIEERITVVNTPGEVAEKCDILTIHLASSPQTKGIVNAEVLARLKPGAYLVNTARPDVLDYKALAEAVREKKLRVALDVYPGEPAAATADFAASIMGLPGVYGTHHIGASTAQAQDAIARETVRIVEAFVRTGEVPNCVNVARKTPAKARLVVRHYDKVGVLANVLGLIREAGINVEEVQNTIFEQAQAASCAIDLDERPPDALLDEAAALVLFETNYFFAPAEVGS